MVLNFQIKGLQDRIIDLTQDNAELMNELFWKDERLEELQDENKKLTK